MEMRHSTGGVKKVDRNLDDLRVWTSYLRYAGMRSKTIIVMPQA